MISLATLAATFLLMLHRVPPAAASLRPAIGPHQESEPIRALLDEDLALIARLRSALVVRPVTVEALQRALPDATCEERDLGLGLRRLELRARGGYTGLSLTAFAKIADEGREAPIAILEIGQGLGDQSQWPAIESELRKAWFGESLEENLPRLRIKRLEPKVEAELRRLVAAKLGGRIDVEPPAELADAFRTLMDPLSSLTVGGRCGFAGFPPQGRREILALVDADRVDLLRAVLRSPNPEARVYAAHALLLRGPLDRVDADAIAKLERQPTQIWTCEGCITSLGDWRAALRALDGRP